MVFTESPYSVRLTEDLILSRKIVDLNQKLPEVHHSLSPLTCIGQWISIASSVCGKVDIEAIFVTTEGHIVVILSDDISGMDIRPLTIELMSWDCNTLDRIAEDFTFSTLGQAFTVCDLLAKHGHIDFSQAESMALQITRCMRSGSFSLFCFSHNAKRL